MSQWNIAAKPKDEQDKVNVDLAFLRRCMQNAH